MSQVTIQRCGNRIRVVPACAELLTPYLTYKKRVQRGGNSRSAEYIQMELFAFDDAGLIATAGMTARICQVLKQNNYDIKFEDFRERKVLDPDYSRLEVLRDKQADILAAIIASDCGVIEAPTGAGKSFLIRQLCKIWWQYKIIICSSFPGVLRQIHQELKEILPENQVGMIGDGRCDLGRRVTCSTDKSLIKCDLDRCDIFIFDEVHRAAAEKTKEVIAHIQHARMYGFSASPYGRSDKADLETESMFGPRICEMEYKDIQATGSIVPIEAYIVNMDHCTPVTASTTTSLERHGLWRNDDRNETIAQLLRWIAEHVGPDPQILISVRTVEHAVYLGSLMPGFSLVYGDMSPDKRIRWERMKLIRPNEHPLTAHQREQYRQDFRDGKLRRVIATGVWGTGLDFPKLEVLIRADGQGGLIPNTQIPGRVSRSSDGKERGVLIDFDDSFNDTLSQRASKRMTAYRKKGWTINKIALAATV